MSAPSADEALVLPPPLTDGPLLFCRSECLTAYVTDVERVGREHHAGHDFENAADGCCSQCGDQVSTPVRDEFTVGTATAVQSEIDGFLSRMGDRNLWSTRDVTDVFLDIRSLLNKETPNP